MAPTRSVRSLIPLVFILALTLFLSMLLSSGCSPSTSDADRYLETDKLTSQLSTEVAVTFPSGDTLVEKSFILDSDKDVELQALRLLFKGQPKGAQFTASVPTATVNSLKVKDGHAVVDFSREVLVQGASEKTQRTALMAVLYTLQQFPQIKDVAFTVEGRTSGKLGGKDVASFWGDVTLSQMPWSVKSSSVEE